MVQPVAATWISASRVALSVSVSAMAVTRRDVPAAAGAAIVTPTSATSSESAGEPMLRTDSGVVTAGPSTQTRSGFAGAPETVTRTICRGFCGGPANRSVDSMARINMNGLTRLVYCGRVFRTQ
jgi:hypothetical protein